jgi:hypothetical protein
MKTDEHIDVAVSQLLVSAAGGKHVASELNIFDVATETPTDSWAHGSAAAKAWFTGSLSAEDEIDFSGEFDTQFSGKFGADALKGLASLSGDLSGAVHAGVKLQAGMPLDLFEAAGILARIRLEASANVRASVTAAMSAGELRGLVAGALPPEAAAYVDIVLDEIKVGATVWARASFAAMVVSELVAAIELFPTDGSPPGVTAYFHYGFGWGYGAGWGVIANVGFDLEHMLGRIAKQAEADLHTALESFRTEQALPANDPLNLGTQLAEVLLPIVIDALVAWCARELKSSDEDRASLGDSLAEAVRTLLVNAILPRIVSFVGEKIVANVAHVPAEQAQKIWGELAAAAVYLAGASDDDDPTAAIGIAAIVLKEIAALLPANVGAPLGSAVRCAAAIVALATDSEDPNLRIVLTPPQASSLKVLAGLVLADELATLLEDEGLIPTWVTPIFGPVEKVVATLTSDGSAAALTANEAIDLLHSMLTSLENMMDNEGLWDLLATKTGFPEMIRAIKAQTTIVTALCASLKDGSGVDGHATREAISVAIIMLIGQPIAQVIATVADKGLAQVPPALTALADEVDASDTPLSINAGWDVLARQVLGTTAAFPIAQLLRHVAGTAAEWHDIRLPVEVKMLQNFLQIDLADEFATNGPAKAVSDFKKQFLPILGQHVIDVVITSHELVLRDSVNLFRDMVTGTVQEIRRSLEVAAIVSFRLVEAAVDAALQAVSALQQQEVSLEQDAERYAAQFLTTLSNVTQQIRGLDNYVGSELTDWMIDQCMGPAAAGKMPDWLRGALRGIVTAAVNISSGGVLSALGTALGTIADLIDASAEALRMTAASEEGSLVGIQPLLESLVQGDHLPNVTIPIGFDIPNPVLPFILPSIHIELARVSIPAQTLSSILLTIIFGSIGLAPLIDTLNNTATSLRVTKGALDTVRGAIAGNSAQQMRQALQAARPGDQLGVDVLDPQPAAVSPSSGTIAFRIMGANLSFVDPAGAGLPQQAISRVQVNVNGQVVSVADISWKATKGGIEGRLDYGPTDTGTRLMLRPGPAAVVVVVSDGYGKLSAQQAWHFVVESAPQILQVLPAWFPISAGLTTPVPQLKGHGPLLGGPHRFVKAANLPVPAIILKKSPRKGSAPAPRWMKARPGVRVDQHANRHLPTGYLLLDHLSEKAAAWCALDGRFGRVDWTAHRVHGWKTKIGGMVQTLRAGGDTIAIGTAAELHCFDAKLGKLLWSQKLGGRSQRVLDATHNIMVIADGRSVIATSPKRGERWSVRTPHGPVAARVSGDRLILAEPGRVRVLVLASGEEEWRAKASGEVLVSRGRLLVPEGSHTSHVYSLHDSVAKKLKTSVALGRPSSPSVRMVDGTLVATVTGVGGIVLVDLPGAVEADRAAPLPRGRLTGAWLAGPFLITTPPLSVAHFWGGIATSIPLDMDPLTGALVAGPGQVLVRGDRSAWLEFS